MDLNLLTICRRARLGSVILHLHNETLDKLEQYDNLFTKISTSDDFTKDEKEYNKSFTIIGIVSIFENYLNKILFEIISSFPRKFGNKKFDIDELTEAGSLLELFHKKASQKILDLAYGKFERFVSEFSKQLEIKDNLDKDLIENINEIKCTRDVIIHSNGVTNGLYHSKVGSKARVYREDQKLKNTDEHIKQSISFIKELIDAIYDNTPKKFKESTKAYIFRQMWNETCLSDRIPFDKAWEFCDSNMVRLKDFETNYGYSSTELALYDMFRGIYTTDFKPDFGFILSRWSPRSKEHQIAQSWLDSPFYF